jgi:hypothetical protein
MQLSRCIMSYFKLIRGSIITIIPILKSINKSINKRLFPFLIPKIAITCFILFNITYIASSCLANLYYI